MVSVLQEIFQWVFVSSIKGGILVAIILFVKSLLKSKLGANWHYGIWGLLFLQLVLPWTPSSPVSMYNLVSNSFVSSALHRAPVPSPSVEFPQPGTVNNSSALENAWKQNTATVGSTLPTSPAAEQPRFKPTVNIIWEFAAWLWLAGAAFFAIRTGTAEYFFRRKIKRSKKVCDPHLLAVLDECKQLAGISRSIALMETNSLKSPALFGIFRTRMLLPAGLAGNLTSQQLSHVFLHELVHFKRHDIAANLIAAILRMVHWFNPVILYGFNRWQDDQELSCDALAVRYLKPEVVREYGRTLISVLEFAGPQPAQLVSAVGISGSKSLSKRRIMMITLFRKTSLKWSLVGAVVIIAIALIALTLPKVNAAKQDAPAAKNQNSSASSSESKGTDSEAQEQIPQKSPGQPAHDLIIYKNTQYGFDFSLPASWEGYSIITDKWEGLAIGPGSDQVIASGPMISIRHPLWTSKNSRQDIPLMIFTLAQWNLLKQEKFHIGAAPIGPSELGRNNGYVFALPARYNYAFPTGYEEVEKILNDKPLKTESITVSKQPDESVAGALSDYFPLRRGSKWVYQGTGNEYASFSREVLFTEGNLAQVLEINGGADVSKVYQLNSKGVYEIFKREEPSDPVNLLHEKATGQRLLLQSPLAVGTKWEDGNSLWEIVDTAATIETPAGTFKNCIKVKSVSLADSKSVMYQYYAKGVGMVQQDFIYDKGEKISSSLESYQLAK